MNKKQYTIITYFTDGRVKQSQKSTPSYAVVKRWQEQAKINTLVDGVEIVEVKEKQNVRK